MPVSFQIHLLGGLSIRFNGTPFLEIRSERLQALMAFLLLHRDAPQTRQQIAVSLWPDETDTNAKANLRRRLHELKQRLPHGDWLQIEKKTVQWRHHEGFELDVTDFESALTQALSPKAQTAGAHKERQAFLEKAISLYRGELFLSCYDEWIEPFRDRFRQQAVTALDTLITQLIEHRQLSTAKDYAQQLQTLDPLSELAYCHLMRIYAQAGDRVSATRVYHQCMTLLQEELGVPPSPSTVSLYENLLTSTDNPEPAIVETATSGVTEQAAHTDTVVPAWRTSSSELSPASPPPNPDPITLSVVPVIDWGEAPDVTFFHGRRDELVQLRQWITEDACRLIAVLGMGGIGKTSLAAKIVHELQDNFDYVIWRSLRNAPPLETLLGEVIPFVSQQQDTGYTLPRLMHWLRQSRCLLILDNLETLLDAKERAGQFQPAYENYRELIEVVGKSDHQSCLILTSREKPAEIAAANAVNRAVQSIEITGSLEASIALIEAKQLTGTQNQKEQLSQRYGHSPLALQIIGGSIRDIFSGDIELFLAEDTLLFNGAKKLLDAQFSRLIPIERSVMFWLAINREWTSIDELMTDIHPTCRKVKLLEAIESLSWRSLIEKRANTYTQQPVVMEYVTATLLEEVGDELINADTFASKGYRFSLLNCYALSKTTVKDFIRESQERLLLKPLADLLTEELLDSAQHILHLFQSLQRLTPLDTGYASGNLINLGYCLDTDFTGQDLSNLVVRQAYLQPVNLRSVDFSGTLFKDSVFSQPMGPSFSLAYSHDGSLLAMGEGSGRVLVWQTSDWKPVLALKDSENWVLSVTFSHDDRWIVSEGNDHRLNVWDVTTGRLARTLEGHNGLVWSVDAHPTENKLVSTGNADGAVFLWDMASGELLHHLEGHTQAAYAAAFSPNGEWIASGGVDQTLILWDSVTGRQVNSWNRRKMITSIEFSPDGHQLIMGHLDGTLDIWDMQNEQIEREILAHQQRILSIGFSPCGQYLASGSTDRTSKLWSAKTGQLLQQSADYTSWVWAVTFSPNRQYLVTACSDHTVTLWTLPQKERFKSLLGYCSWVTTVHTSPDNSLLASGSDDCNIRLWNLSTGELLKTIQGHDSWVFGIAFSPCGRWLASASNDKTIKIWDVNTGKPTQTLIGHTNSAYSVMFSPDGHYLVSGSFEQTVRYWEVATGRLIHTLEGHQGWALQAQFSPDGQTIASGGSDGVINLWDASGNLATHWQGHAHTVWTVCFSRDGRHLATGGEDSNIKIWDAKTGELLTTLDEHRASIYAIAYSPDGKFLATAGDDCMIKLWRTKTYSYEKTLQRHQSRVSSLAFSADSQVLVSGSNDETIGIWDVASGKSQLTLRAPRPYEGMNITDVQGLTEAQQQALVALGAVTA